MADPSVIADELCAPEGPTVGPADWVLNVCSFTRDESWPTRGGDIVATRLTDPLRSFIVFNSGTKEVDGIPAALAFGPDGALYVTDEGRRTILRVTSDLQTEDFIDSFHGEPLNGPNDLSFDPDGNLFFTDPWGSSLDEPIGAVYGYDWAAAELHRIDDGLAFPNGIVVRHGNLYAAETLTGRIYVYHVDGAGRASNRDLFCQLPSVDDIDVHGPDGMAFDRDGRLFVTHFGGGGVHVYDRRGQYLDTIDPGGANPTNVCFGGAGHRTLLITVDDTARLVALDVDVPGDVVNHCPSITANPDWDARLATLESTDREECT